MQRGGQQLPGGKGPQIAAGVLRRLGLAVGAGGECGQELVGGQRVAAVSRVESVIRQQSGVGGDRGTDLAVQDDGAACAKGLLVLETGQAQAGRVQEGTGRARQRGDRSERGAGGDDDVCTLTRQVGYGLAQRPGRGSEAEGHRHDVVGAGDHHDQVWDGTCWAHGLHQSLVLARQVARAAADSGDVDDADRAAAGVGEGLAPAGLRGWPRRWWRRGRRRGSRP
ncbi:hypothetical protein ADZ36_16650 [Streptomyces fradiae]|uniref:Uncharacterized protein n=1 Tax=Streptomyces fradiae TaxID=1906 RepID=A0ACC4WA75_STRFR|nr:hypothetical protein ADZ36_16650 [Streptomyces fradiae]OFA48252.1 hypothetical protein BEN35_19115 [Streptomyces fradiae]